MSVINRMLLDLDERHGATAHQLPGMVRAVPARLPKTPYRIWLTGFLLSALLLSAGIFIWRSTTGWKKPAAVSALQSPRLQLSTNLELTPPPPVLNTDASVQAITVAPTAPQSANAPPPEANTAEHRGTKFLLKK